MNRAKRLLVSLALLLLPACGGSPTQPAPPPPPPPPPPTLLTITGIVAAEEPPTAIGGARVEVVDGPDAGRNATSGEDGRYTLLALRPGQFSIRVTADGFDTQTRSVSLASDLVSDFTLRATAPKPPPANVVSGLVVDGISDAAVGGATIDVAGVGSFATEGNGTFRIEAPDPEQLRLVTIKSATTVERQTHLRVPGPETRLTLFPSSFDLSAFDQMFRGTGRLDRWVEAPRLTIQRRVLQFTDVSESSYVATDELMTDEEVDQLVADFTWGLPQLTGGRFTSFAAERRETANVGEAVFVRRTGEIMVARYRGLTAATTFWGYARWAFGAPGTVIAGIVKLDRDFELSGSPFRRSLRVHELGHALGCNHVTIRQSVMNASARLEPNDFDRSAARLAFLRPPSNRSPDIDPDEFSSNLLSEFGRWMGAH